MTVPSEWVRYACHVVFSLLARKLILCSELMAVTAAVGWRADRLLGLALWPSQGGLVRRGAPLAAASAIIVQVLFVGFIRDYGELGPGSRFIDYAWACLAVMALLVAGAAAGLRIGKKQRAKLVDLAIVWALAGIGVKALQAGIASFSPWLKPLGQAFHADVGAEAEHGAAAFLMATMTLGAVVHYLRTGPRLASIGPWGACFLSGALALAQGFLAFRAVSALYLLSAAALVAWLSGWRVAFRRGDKRTVLVLRAPAKAEATSWGDPRHATVESVSAP